MKKLSYVKLHEAWCLYILLIPCVIPLWDSATTHSPSGKELNPSSQKDAHFSGRCTLAYDFQFILRHPSLDSATAHSPSAKELHSSSFNQSCLSGLIVVWCSVIILTGLSLFWCSPILLIKPYMHLYYFIPSVVYFYSESPPLSKHFILCVVYFYSERPLLFLTTLVELSKKKFFRKNFTKQCFGLPQEESLITLPLLQ